MHVVCIVVLLSAGAGALPCSSRHHFPVDTHVYTTCGFAAAMQSAGVQQQQQQQQQASAAAPAWSDSEYQDPVKLGRATV
jgi:hypothetical protein